MELSGKERGVSTIKLAKALECIESALSGVLNRIQQLNDESLQAKEEISQTFGRQISHLHNRETQLLRQVDVIFRSRGELLQKQLAHCYRILGSLETSRKWSEQLNQRDVEISSSEFQEMEKWATSISLNWNLDENRLSEAIANFGQVDMDGVHALLLPNTEQSSSCLPNRLEEYLEEEHQVLNKPLHTNVIDIKFPKLPKDYSYWLARPSSISAQNNEDSSNYGPYRKGTDSYKACDVQTWLGCIQSATATEPMDDDVSSSSPELVSLSDAHSLNSKDSDSIEIISEKCKQESTSSFEIENLGNSLASFFMKSSSTSSKDSMSIFKVCRANEVCESFDDCVCEVNCGEAALKNRDTNKNRDIQLLQSKENVEDKEDYRRWLAPREKETPPLPLTSVIEDVSQWLHPDSLASLANRTAQKNANVVSILPENGDYRQWLWREDTNSTNAAQWLINPIQIGGKD